MAGAITVQEVVDACSKEAAWRISEAQAQELLDRNARKRTPHATAVEIAREFFCEMEERSAQAEEERRDLEYEMDGIPDPDFESAIACGEWP